MSAFTGFVFALALAGTVHALLCGTGFAVGSGCVTGSGFGGSGLGVSVTGGSVGSFGFSTTDSMGFGGSGGSFFTVAGGGVVVVGFSTTFSCAGLVAGFGVAGASGFFTLAVPGLLLVSVFLGVSSRMAGVLALGGSEIFVGGAAVSAGCSVAACKSAVTALSESFEPVVKVSAGGCFSCPDFEQLKNAGVSNIATREILKSEIRILVFMSL